MKQNTTEHMMTMYRFKPEERMMQVLTVLYTCLPSLIPGDTLVSIVINVPSCKKPFQFNWIKKCGMEYVPFPGFMVDLVSGKNPTWRKQIVTDGLVKFPYLPNAKNKK